MRRTALRFSVETGADGTITICQDTDLVVILPEEVDALVKLLQEARRESTVKITDSRTHGNSN